MLTNDNDVWVMTRPMFVVRSQFLKQREQQLEMTFVRYEPHLTKYDGKNMLIQHFKTRQSPEF